MTDQVAQLRGVLEAIAREFGSAVDDLSRDPDSRHLLARQLVVRGVQTGAVVFEDVRVAEVSDRPEFVAVTATSYGTIVALDATGRLWQGSSTGQGKMKWEEIERPLLLAPAAEGATIAPTIAPA